MSEKVRFRFYRRAGGWYMWVGPYGIICARQIRDFWAAS